MEGSIIGALIGAGFLTVVNIAAIAYSYGKVTQSIRDLCRRVNVLEQTVKNGGK